MPKKQINQDFFKAWTPEMSYVLGFVVADGCIAVSKNRKHPFTLNITSVKKRYLYPIRKALNSEHKISKKPGGNCNIIAYQLQIRNPVIAKDLMNLGILPRKTYNLNPIKVPDKYFPDFVRGFFDGDGTVYVYEVNRVLQIKASFVSPNLLFIMNFNRRVCERLNIPLKTIHQDLPTRKDQKLTKYYIDFYVNDCEKLVQFIYGNNPTLYFPCKRRVFERWKSIKRRHYIKQNYPSKIGWHLNEKLLS